MLITFRLRSVHDFVNASALIQHLIRIHTKVSCRCKKIQRFHKKDNDFFFWTVRFGTVSWMWLNLWYMKWNSFTRSMFLKQAIFYFWWTLSSFSIYSTFEIIGWLVGECFFLIQHIKEREIHLLFFRCH